MKNINKKLDLIDDCVQIFVTVCFMSSVLDDREYASFSLSWEELKNAERLACLFHADRDLYLAQFRAMQDKFNKRADHKVFLMLYWKDINISNLAKQLIKKGCAHLKASEGTVSFSFDADQSMKHCELVESKIHYED